MSRCTRHLRCIVITASFMVLCTPPIQAEGGNSPRVNYMLHCMGCHMMDGSGAPGAVPSLRGRMASFLQVDAGRAYLIQVPGTAQSPLNDAEVAEVVNWMLEEFTIGPLPADFQPYSEEEVAGYRSVRPVYLGAARAKITAQIARQGQ